jgi:hypothetical protein
VVVVVEAEAAMPAQHKDKAHPEIAAKLQLAPTKDKVVPANMVTVVVVAVVVVAGAAATAAQYLAAIKVAMLECKATVQELVKIRPGVLLVAHQPSITAAALL